MQTAGRREKERGSRWVFVNFIKIGTVTATGGKKKKKSKLDFSSCEPHNANFACRQVACISNQSDLARYGAG